MPNAETPPITASTRAFQIALGLLVVLVLVQAMLAGQFLFSGGEIDIHGYVGNASFTLGLVVVVLAFVSRQPGWLFGLSVALLCVLFAQTGLGYVGRENADAASWHIPLGVAAFGCSVGAFTASLLTPLRR